MAETAPTDPLDPAAAEDDDLAALLRAANRGDRAAYARFLHAVAALLGDIIAAHGPDMPPTRQERIVHEVLIALHDNRHTWCGTVPFRAWLCALAGHRIAASLRRRGRAVVLRPGDFSGVPHGARGHAAPDDDAIRARPGPFADHPNTADSGDDNDPDQCHKPA